MPRRRSPQPSRQEIHWVPEDRKVEMQVPPLRVWTCMGEGKPELPMTPQHNRNAFLEDKIHDWHWRNGVLRYYSRVAQSGVWILCEFE